MAEVTEITVSYGITQNLGDYTNVKISVSMTATLEPVDDVETECYALLNQAKREVHEKVDDEMEVSQLTPKYHDGPLYTVHWNKARGCVVIAPAGAKMPKEDTWRTSDYWRTLYDEPERMRLGRAMTAAERYADSNDLVLIDCADGDLSLISPMPDDGPEPDWHKKDLAWPLKNNLGIPEEMWDELGALEHVSRDWLEELRRATPYGTKADVYVQYIRDGVIPQLDEPESDAEDYDDDDFDDYEEPEYDGGELEYNEG